MKPIYPDITDRDYIGSGYFTARLSRIGALFQGREFPYRRGQIFVLEKLADNPAVMHIIGGMTCEGMREFTPSYVPEYRHYIARWRLTDIRPRLG